jgi:oxygen-dependent protoporphyrinogen oxidase
VAAGVSARAADAPLDVLVVGGGLAGLACARALVKAGGPAPPEVLVLEAHRRPGGKALTDVEGGWVLEWGPQSFLDDPDGPLRTLIREVGLADEVVEPRPAARLRFVLHGGRLWSVPRQAPRLLGLAGSFAAALEPLRRPRRDGAEETVHDFAVRRFGARAAERLFGALVTGIYAGDARRLSLDAALPRVRELEARHGSLIRALVGGGFVPRRTATLRRGLGSLTDALARDLGPRLRLGEAVTALRPPRAPGEPWVAATPAGEHRARTVVLALPAYAAAALVCPFDPALAAALEAIPYVPVAAVALGYPPTAFPAGPPRGFGYLVPPGEGDVLGCLFPSSSFDGMAPEGAVLLRVLLGGALDPGALDRDDEALVARARAAVEPVTRAAGPPTLTRVYRHPRAIPQYELGHAARVAEVEARCAAWPGLAVTGNAYRGVSLVDVARDGARVAEQIAARIRDA